MELKPKRYWRRWRGYEKLDGSSSESNRGRKKVKRVKMDPTRKKRSWRIKIVPKMKLLKRTSPKKLLVWIRDAYVKMMMRLANSRAVVGASGYGGGSGFGSGQIKEYDEKMLVEIYKSILMAKAQGNLVHRDVADHSNNKLGSSEPVVVSTVVR